MSCTSCGRANPADARFCGGCGNSLAPRCSACGAESAADARFCMACGASLAARPAAASGARKVVTIVFADLVGSTALHERLDAESARAFMEGYYTAMRGAVESHGGTVTQLLGDGVKAVFGIPRVAEDDAIRAVRAAVAMQDAFRALAEQQRGAVGKTGLRVAVNTGEVVANDEAEIIGDPVNVAARLQEQGGDGDVVVGESTHRLVSALITLVPLGSFALKGRSEQVKAYRVESLERPAGAATTAFVGRDDEFARIAAVYDAAIAKPAAHLAVLLGSPGLGKSRLIDEFARRCGDTATVIAAHCDAAASATFAPLADALRECLTIEAGASGDALRAAVEAATPGDDADRARIASGIAALLAGSPASPEETFFVVRRFLAALATVQPVVLVIDDLHWAEPLLLDLIEHLVQWGVGVPLLVLVGARPELRDSRSSLATPGALVADVVTLGGLDAGAAMRLAANVIGAADLPAAVAAKVLAASEGNPLFVGELVRMLVHEGALKKEGERWTTGTALAALEMPPTIHALLAARIERLRPEERSVLERAAVVGRHFSRSAIAELLPRDVTDLDARLESLRRSELIERDTGWFLGEPGLRFHHVLIRDAAYRRLLKGTRAELHARFADWIETKAPESVEHEETLGWHLEQAHQHLRELGPIDDKGRALGERAAEHLAAAGRRALARDDVPLAAGLLGRALDRLDPSDAARADLALDWCEALLAAGDVGPAAAAIDELGRFTAEDARLRAWHTCFVGQLTVMTAPQALLATADAVATAAAELTSLGDAAGEAKAHFVHAQAFARLGQVGACEAALDRALAAARRAGDRRRANTVLAVAPLAALWGPSPVTRASGRCLDVVRVLRITQGAPAVESVALSCQGVLEALRGRTDAARRMIASARKMVEELGITQRLLEADVFAARIELLEGDAAAAERGLRGAYEGLRDLGLGIDAARAAALLARALLALDRVDEAEALSRESEALAGDDLQASIAWRGVRAEALARRGEHAAAVELASKAVEIAAATDALLYHADARLALAAALRAAGRGRDADAEERRATELWEAKGATLLAERTAHAAAPVAVSVAAAAPRAAHAPRRRPVRPNFAFEEMRRAEAAVAARDARALEALYRREVEIVDHQFGITYGYDAIVERVRAIIEESTDGAFAHEPVASLGDSLALCRMRSTASGSTVHGIPVGATEVPYLLLIEADEQGSARNIEIFGDDKLADARVRLYQRYAELLPEGAERMRALAAAHSLATLRSSEGADPDRLALVLAPDFEGIDHRHLSNWSLRGAEAYIEHLRALRQVADDIVFRESDILALAPRAMLVATLHTGTARAGGGAYERAFLTIFATDAEGRLARAEWFDADREAEALARFDALAANASPQRAPRRRVRANAATRALARFDACFAAGDVDAVVALYQEDSEEINHPTAASYGRAGGRDSLRRILRASDPYLTHAPLATLGDSLALARRSAGASASAGTLFDVGTWERAEVFVAEVGSDERLSATEIFASDRLGDAIVRLYERYAALLPEGPERARAVATARALDSMLLAPVDLDRPVTVFAADFESIDHRHLSTWSLRGGAAFLRHVRALHEVAADVVIGVDDVLALVPRALLVRRMHAGTERVGGGAYERPFLLLLAAGADGRIARAEWFDADREGEALARFDALTTDSETPHSVRRRVRPNAATAMQARFDLALAARDFDALAAHFHADHQEIDHPTGSTYGRDACIASMRRLFRSNHPYYEVEAIAALGEFLVLVNRRSGAGGASSGRYDVGAYENEAFQVFEVNERGLCCRSEVFAADRLGDAIVRLYERHAERLHEGAARERAEATARSVAVVAPGGFDRDRYAAAFRPHVEIVDHKLLGFGIESGPERLFRTMAAMTEVGDQLASRPQDVLALTHDALLLRWLVSGVGRESGGAFEWAFLRLFVFDAGGGVTRYELFDADREAEALARFEALFGRVAEPAPDPFDNAASRADRLLFDRFNARDWPGIEALAAPDLVFDERRRMLRNACGREVWLEQFRVLFDVPASRFTTKLLATRGERLALSLHRFEGEVAGGGGPLAMDDHLVLHEVDRDGRIVAIVLFDLEDEDAAYTELDARFDADTSQAYARTTVAFDRAIARRDWEAVAALCSAAFVEHDHRSLAVLGTTHGAEAWMQNFRALVALAPDTIYRTLHARAAARGFLSVGTWQGSREGGRYEIPLIAVCGVDARGAITRADLYEPDQLGQVRARFDALDAPRAADPARRRIRANAATRGFERFTATLTARDRDALASHFDESLVVVHHPSGASYGRREMIATWRGALKAERFAFGQTILASLGDTLALDRHLVSVEGLSEAHLAAFGHAEFDEVSLLEVDDHGRWLRSEIFAADHLGDALVRLYERYAERLPEGPERRRAAATARSVAAWSGPANLDRMAATVAPSFECDDHRPFHTWSSRGRDEWIEHWRMWLHEVTADQRLRDHEVLAIEASAFLVRRSYEGTGRNGSGEYENLLLVLFAFDADGLLVRVEGFEPDHEVEALARFEALFGGAAALPARNPFDNAASRADRQLFERFNARDWPGIEALAAPDLVFDERRRMLRNSCGRDVWLEQFRVLFDVPASRFATTLRATRGERLALSLHRFEGEVAGGGGPLAMDDHLVLHEVDRDGGVVAIVLFDLEDEEAAYAELDARFECGEALERRLAAAWYSEFQRAFASREWDAMTALQAADQEAHDHRLVGWGTLRGAGAWTQTLQELVTLAPDVRQRVQDVRLCARGVLWRHDWYGTRDGGAFESSLLVVVEFDGHGRQRRLDVWDVDRQGAALARFAELAAPGAEDAAFANAASAIAAPIIAAVVANDWARYEALFAETFRGFDRRRMVRLEFDRDAHVAFARELAEGRRARGGSETLATRGERLALIRLSFEFEDADVGPSEIVSLFVTEVDERGRFVAYVRFDDDDVDAAYAELDARFEAGEGVAQRRVFAAWLAMHTAGRGRDWDALASLHAPEFVLRDHRLLGWGTLVNDAATFVRLIRSARELAPDAEYRTHHLRICTRGILARMLLSGTRDGGAFETPFLRVTEMNEQGLMLGADLYDESDFERALARFAELAALAEPTPLRFENAASRAWRAVIDAWRARDVARFEALQPRPLRYRDHRRLFQLDLDRQGFLDFTRPLLTMRTGSTAIELVATRGERLALFRFTMTMEDETVGPSAIDSLLLVETDERGEIAAYDRWDLEDADAAYTELDARWDTGEGAAYPAHVAFRRDSCAALERRNWDALAACYAPDFVGEDHRLVSWGTLRGPAFVAGFRAMIELAPDARMRWDHLRVSGRVLIAENIWLGPRDGGAFESPFVQVTLLGAHGKAVQTDVYDPHHLDRALARFEEIRASERREGPAASTVPNLATAAMERNWTAFDALDLDAADAAREAARAHYAPDFVWDDRRPLVGLSGDLDLMLASVRERLIMGARQQRTILGTVGERVAIGRVLWAGGPADGRFEVEFLVVSEVNEAGLFTALIFFEPDDTRAAQREAWSRWAAIDPVAAPWVELLNELTDGWNARDRAGILARFAADVVVVDHRLTGVGRIEGSAAYVDANAVLWDLAPDQRVEFGWSWLASDRHGLVATLRRFGTLPDGGAFESEYVWLSLASGGRITHLELFEIDAQGAALARFETLRPRKRSAQRAEGERSPSDPLRIPPNAATRSLAPIGRLLADGDLDALRALVTHDFCFDDRTRRSLLRGGVAEWVGALQFLSRETRAHLDAHLVATAGDRLALYHDVWQEAPGESRFRMESHRLIEIDAAGRLHALVLFDANDRAAAHQELFERYVALGADGMPAAMIEFQRAMNDHDLARARAALPADFVLDDHRRTGLGRIDGADAYVASVAAVFELSPDARWDVLYYLAAAPHGFVSVNRMSGTNGEGGDFESPFVALLRRRDDRFEAGEMFEIDHLDAALARLEELSPEPLRLPQTAATRMRDRHRDAFVARDWDAIRALTGADFVFEDRGKRALVRGNVETWIASMEFTAQPGFRVESPLIGTLGDRIVLDHLRWFGEPGGDAFEFERVRVLEVGADGLLCAVLFFDPEDRLAASIEGLARFAVGEAAGSGLAPQLAFFGAVNERDWEAARACFAPDFVLEDHRPLSFGSLDRDEWIASIQANYDLSVGLTWDVFRVLAWNEHGSAIGIRRLGTIPDGGGPFENQLFTVTLWTASRIARQEIFDDADAERAVARFEELCALTAS